MELDAIRRILNIHDLDCALIDGINYILSGKTILSVKVLEMYDPVLSFASVRCLIRDIYICSCRAGYPCVTVIGINKVHVP